MSEQDFTKRNVEQPVEEIKPPAKEIVGVITGCRFLNIRTKPDIDSTIICIEPALSELIIDNDKSTDEWYSVCTVSGVEGFCVKNFVTIKQ